MYRDESIPDFIEHIRNNLKEEAMHTKQLVVTLLRVKGLDSCIRDRLAESIERIITRNATNLDLIDRLEGDIPISLLYKAKETEDGAENELVEAEIETEGKPTKNRRKTR